MTDTLTLDEAIAKAGRLAPRLRRTVHVWIENGEHLVGDDSDHDEFSDAPIASVDRDGSITHHARSE